MSTALCDPRLGSAASLVRQGAVFADIGTDHAYLPLFLLESGRITRALCTDITDGPLASARAHASGSPVRSRMEFIKTDGLDGLSSRGLTDIAICGMGGELIADILSRAPVVRDANIRLILQPMTRQEHLRRYLAREGFAITDECYSESDGKYYLTLAAHFTGEVRELTVEQATVGLVPVPPSCVAYRGYLMRKRQALSRAVEGKRRGGEDVSEPSAALLAIEHILNNG